MRAFVTFPKTNTEHSTDSIDSGRMKMCRFVTPAKTNAERSADLLHSVWPRRRSLVTPATINTGPSADATDKGRPKMCPPVTPAKAGIHKPMHILDSRYRGNDGNRKKKDPHPFSKKLLGLLGLGLVVLSLGGCAWFSTQTSSPTPAGSAPTSTTGTAPAATPSYYDFPDIPVPSELSLVTQESTVFQGGTVRGGVLTLKGRVEPSSVVNFFMVALARENWKHRGDIRYRKSVLLFEKPDRFCIISIRESTYYTYVEVYVVPTGAGNRSGSLEPLGEAHRAEIPTIVSTNLQ